MISSLPASWESIVLSLNMSHVVLNMNSLPAKLNIEAQRRKKKNMTDSKVTNVAKGANSSKQNFFS